MLEFRLRRILASRNSTKRYIIGSNQYCILIFFENYPKQGVLVAIPEQRGITNSVTIEILLEIVRETVSGGC